MTLELLAQLGILALIDSTSIGTLVIPVWLMMRPGARRTVGKVAVYLAAVGVFYFLVGLVLLSGATGMTNMLGGGVGSLLELPAVQGVMVAAGAGMLIWSFKDTGGISSGLKRQMPRGPGITSSIDSSDHASTLAQDGVHRLQPGGIHGPHPPHIGSRTAPGAGSPDGADSTKADSSTVGGAKDGNAKTAAARRSEATELRWQHRIGQALNTRGGLLGLALLAGILELPTMLPYLAAVGLVTGSGTEWAASAGILGLYCLVMLMPALLLVGARLLLDRHLDGPLERLGAWLSKASGEAVLWVVGIVGFLILRAGLAGLFPGASWNPFG